MRRKGREKWEGRWAVTRKREKEGGRQSLRERQRDRGGVGGEGKGRWGRALLFLV